MPRVTKQLTILDYDKDEVKIDARMDCRLYVECRSPESAESTCCSIDRPAARAMIDILSQWIGPDETNGITPCTITYEE